MGIVSCGQRVSTARRGLSPGKKPEGLGFKLEFRHILKKSLERPKHLILFLP